MISMAHVIQPFTTSPGTDLHLAQPITIESMHVARSFAHAQGGVSVKLLAAQLRDDPRMELAPDFLRTRDLSRTVADMVHLPNPRPLPLIADILERAAETSPDSDFLVYTNVDIGLQPHFYLAVAQIIQSSCRAFIINRRTIPAAWSDPRDLPLMWAEMGEPHPGWDCFVFPRSMVPDFRLGAICIGAGWFGRALLTNMACLEPSFRVFTDVHLTFHLGNDRAWLDDRYKPLIEHNKGECRIILEHFDRTVGPLDRATIPGRFFNKFRPSGDQ